MYIIQPQYALSYLQEGYHYIIIIILLLNVLQGIPMSFAFQVILQLLTIGYLNITKVTDDGASTRNTLKH